MSLMIFPLPVWEFGFRSPEAFVIWTVLCVVMLLAYFIFWSLYLRNPSLPVAIWLAILPSAIFILRGAFLRHWLLTASGVLFAIGHISITWFNNKPEVEGK
jgi:hypothetical protein